jgi:hypothetical protein
MSDDLEVRQLSSDEARALTDRIRSMVAGLLPLIREAFEMRAWAALGYATWDEYCDEELRGIRLPVADRRELVRGLYEAGVSQRSIAPAAGISHTQVRRDLDGVERDVPRETVTDSLGRQQPAMKPRPTAADAINALLVPAGWILEVELREELAPLLGEPEALVPVLEECLLRCGGDEEAVDEECVRLVVADLNKDGQINGYSRRPAQETEDPTEDSREVHAGGAAEDAPSSTGPGAPAATEGGALPPHAAPPSPSSPADGDHSSPEDRYEPPAGADPPPAPLPRGRGAGPAERFADADPAKQRTKWKLALASGIENSGRVTAFTSEQIAEQGDREDIDEVLRFAADINRWAERSAALWRDANKLRSVSGGRQ